jgi:RND family efflux transporter MFP subunit
MALGNIMNKLNLFLATLIISTATFLSACNEPEQPYVAGSRPVKTIVIGGTTSGDTRTFPAVVDAIQKAEVSFRVSGKIQKILVKEGDAVKKDQLLAELDPTDFNIRLKDQQASFNTAKANYDRAKALVEKGAISKVDHDNIRAKYFTAKANLDQAEQDLLYTKLNANFDGYIAKRFAENFEEVQASQTIFSLEDVSALKIIIDVPENLMVLLKRTPDAKRKLSASFTKIKGVDFPLSYVESTTKADATTKTFKVTLKMDAPADYNILPGMTATVTAEVLQSELSNNAPVVLPVSAVIANNEKQASVWVVNEDTMTVSPKNVTPGLVIGDSMQVTGLNAGERVVTAGAAFLREGMKVSLLETGEQPK